MLHADRPAPPPALEQSLRRYLVLARSCHELFAVTLGGDKPPEHAAMDELLRALEGAGQLPHRAPAPPPH
jgi:hypothetical protein